ncbi:MAG: winged helix-turn-helix domain-containing protein [Burkholderiales bacterium]
MTTPDALLRFGRCEVDVVGRSLRLDGDPVAVEPRPFELLTHLIRQRHRVVSRQELLEKVWPGRRVSSSALARAVMKLRQALGDTDEAPLIRTVPRVGYRFASALIGEAAQPARLTDALTLALLPFENATGDATLGWIELGLMAMVAEALVGDRRLSLVGMQSLLGVGAAAGESSVAARAAAVQRDTGAQRVVHGRVARTAAGFRLDFRLCGESNSASGSVSAAQPTGLAADLVQALTRMMFDAAPATAPAPFLDPMAREAYARGLQMAAEQRWMPALNLFHMALDLEPGHPAVQLGLLQALAPTSTDDAEVEALAAELLANAEREGDLVAAPQVHRTVGFYHLNRRAFGAAEARLQLAIRLADGRESLDWTARTLLLRSSVAFQQRRFADVHAHLDRARALCEHSGNRVQALAVLNLDAILASVEGRHERYVQLSIDGAQRARELRKHRDLCDACGNAANGLVELGRLAEAAAWAEEGFAAALAVGDRSAIDDHAANACGIYRLAGEPLASARVLAELEKVLVPVHRQEAVWRARGHHAAISGDPHAAARCFSAAMQLLREAKFSDLEQDQLPWFIEALILADRPEQAQTEILHAAQLAADGNHGLQIHLLLLRALLAHRQGQPGAAVGFLEEALAAQPAPLWRTWACADAAWLLAESGDVVAATAWLAQIDPALSRLPVVLTAQARVLQATHAGHARCAISAAQRPRALTLPSRLAALPHE